MRHADIASTETGALVSEQPKARPRPEQAKDCGALGPRVKAACRGRDHTVFATGLGRARDDGRRRARALLPRSEVSPSVASRLTPTAAGNGPLARVRWMERNMRRRMLSALVCMVVLLSPRIGWTDGFPSRPVRIVSPFAAGGPSDVVARALGQSLSEVWGKPVVVENRVGAGGTIGADVVAKSTPDGHTLLLMNPGGLSIVQTLYGDLPFDIHRDLAPITMVAVSPYVIAVHPGVPAASLRDLVEVSRARSGQLNFASGGNGTVPHLAGVVLQEVTGVRWVHVPYRGDAASLPDLLAGRMDVTVITVLAALPHLRSGALRGLAVTTSARSSFVPDLPTAAEAGLPGFEYAAWQAAFTAGRTPRPLVERLHADIVRAAQTLLVRERLASQGAEPHWNTPDAFRAWMRDETAKYARVIQANGIRPD